MPATTTRSGALPLGQLVSDLLDRQVTKLDQDRPQRLCISIRSALVLLRLLGIAELDAERLRRGKRLLGADRNVTAFLLGQRRVDVQHETINVGPSSATTNGTFCVISPLMKCTSRLRRSSLATTIGHLHRLASANAIAS
jgi:hypothetical protein